MSIESIKLFFHLFSTKQIVLVYLFFPLYFISFSSTNHIHKEYPYSIALKDSIKPNKINKTRLALVSSSVPILTAGVFIYFQNAWWNDTLQSYGLPKSKFHFDDSKEMKYALGLDKCGHFWSSQLTSSVFGELLVWSGFPIKKAKWIGASFAILTSGIVEIKDGMAPWWGFSLTDMSANVLGSLYPVLQEYEPFFKNFNFKWSYDFLNKSYYKTIPTNVNKSFMDDYERHTYWLCSNISGLSPAAWKRYIPAYLSFDIGLSAEKLDGHGLGKKEWFVAIGLDLSRINFKKYHFIQKQKHIINQYRLPTPAQKLYPRNVGYLLSF